MKTRIVLNVLLCALVLGQVALGQLVDNSTPPHITFSAPTIAITTATADSAPGTSISAREAHVYWKFGTVVGSYTTCTVQAKTTYDGTNYLTLGSAVSITATTGTGTAWSIFAQNGTTNVTTSSPSTTVALSFGQKTKFTFTCSGAYGTSAPATISVIYR